MNHALPTKVKVVLSFASLFLIFSFSFFAGKTFAASDSPIPAPGRIPCPAGSEGSNFDSLRPYQASPCGGTVKARYCSNDLDFIEDFNVKGEGDCHNRYQALGEYDFTCNPNHFVDKHNLYVDLADSQFPIEGNTEQVQNSVSTSDTIDDATKVNEYVSWYLNGVDNRAEYGNSKNTDNETVNYSGPIQKLMPQAILEAQRIATIASVSGTVAQDTEDEDVGAAAPLAQPGNHNQIVVCAKKSFSIPTSITNFLGLGSIGIGNEVPINCYPSANSRAQGDVFRLGGSGLSWEGTNTAQDIVNWASQNLAKIFSGNGAAQVLAGAANRWSFKTPPLPWDNGTGKPFASSMLYQKAYNEWRGQLCAIVDSHLFCLGAWPWMNNPYADLFPYVPLANTVDKKGVEYIVDVQFQPSGQTQIIDQTYNPNTKKAPLYFAHTQETADLSTFLNSSYTPKDFSSVPLPATTETNDCSALNVRTNAGDNLFPGYPHGIEVDDVTYTITQAECHESITNDNCSGTKNHKSSSGQGFGCISNVTTCNAEVIIVIKTGTKTPFADQIFSSTVADSGSTFRKIYPKVGPDAPVSCIADMPTVTNVTYTATSTLGSKGSKDFKVVNYPDDGGATKDTPQLTFPHIGSVYDYFLKGIQTALRPQGFADPTPVSGQFCNSTACGQLPTNLPKASGTCSLGGVDPRVGTIPLALKNIISAAAQTYKVPPSLIVGIMYGEGLFNPGRFNWTDTNVKNWASCQKVPGCNETGDDNFMGFNGTDFTNITPHILPDLQKLDPTKKTLSQCNLLDAIYAEAWNLHDSADGGMNFSCFGINLNALVPSSCAWNQNQLESAIKISENGYDKGCFTLPGSCAKGGGNAALCNNGVDGCETIQNRGAYSSHNACIWDVSTYNGGSKN